MPHSMDTPTVILMLTARENKEDMSQGLEAGADDFVGKSSDLSVVKARIRALLRRKFFQEENQRIARELFISKPIQVDVLQSVLRESAELLKSRNQARQFQPAQLHL